MNEMEQKEKKLREYMKDKGYKGVILFRRDTFSWLTCGKVNHVVTCIPTGKSTLLITADHKYLISNQFEKYRVMDEELEGLGYELLEINWWEEDVFEYASKFLGEGKIAADMAGPNVINVYSDLAKLRFSLYPEEIERYREVGLICADAVEETCRELCQGQTENEIAAILAGKLAKMGVDPGTVMVASDERIYKYRHPIPTTKRADKYVEVGLCGRKYGLFGNLTRFVHFGKVPDELMQKFETINKINAEVITNTVVGKRIPEILKELFAEYELKGYKDEWKLMHQGGPTGFGPREYLATLTTDEIVHNNQAYTWNSSITGAKSEDTILVNQSGFEILTDSHRWPVMEIKAKNGITVRRPDLLIR